MRKLLVGLAAFSGLFFLSTTVASAQTPTPTKYTVRSGDTLWGIGIRYNRTWPQLASFNHIANADLIYVGQTVVIPPASYVSNYIPASAPRYTPPVTHTVHATVTYTAPRTHSVTRQPTSYGAPGSFQACVATRESGNGSGSSNIYGILDSTWHSLGRSGSAWSASRSEQDAAFAQLYAMDGRQPWSPYDGC